jgi:cell wall-associated NlpC family hydrolase
MTLDRRLAAARPDLADERLRGKVTAGRYVAGVPRRVVAPVASLHRDPVPDAPVDTQVLMGEALLVFEEEEGWAWVQSRRDDYVGYVSTDALGAEGAPPTHRVTALRTFLYPGPDLKLPPAAHLSLGAEVSVTAVDGTYARLATGGCVFAGHLAPTGDAVADFVAVAESLIGAPYLWGGKSSLGLDCSGLVQLALFMAGVPAPRDSDQQERELGEAIDPDGPLRRGDLVFWKGHVGIMLDAATLLHANGHTMTVVSEPLSEARGRILAKTFGPVTSAKRLPARPAQ